MLCSAYLLAKFSKMYSVEENRRPIHNDKNNYRFLTNLGLKVQPWADSVPWSAKKMLDNFKLEISNIREHVLTI